MNLFLLQEEEGALVYLIILNGKNILFGNI